MGVWMAVGVWMDRSGRVVGGWMGSRMVWWARVDG